MDRFANMRAVATAISRIEPIEDLEWIRKAVDDEIIRRRQDKAEELTTQDVSAEARLGG